MSRRSSPVKRPDPFLEHCRELLAPLGTVRSRAMFGGHGLYVDDLFIALIAGDQFYLKADAQNRPQYEAAGCEPFTYARTGPDGQADVAQLNYYRPPEEAMDSPALMQPWARRAMEAALRAANVKRPRTPEPPKARKAPRPLAAAKVKPSPSAGRKRTG